jgi:hypothetical protein
MITSAWEQILIGDIFLKNKKAEVPSAKGGNFCLETILLFSYIRGKWVQARLCKYN